MRSVRTVLNGAIGTGLSITRGCMARAIRTARAIVVCGVSGSGKTTVGAALAARLCAEFADADDFHPPANIERMRAGIALTDRDREPWLHALRAHIDQTLERGTTLVLACSALKACYREILGIDQRRIISVYLEGTPELIAARLSARQHAFMPAQLLKSQFAALEPPNDGLRLGIERPPEELVQRILEQLPDGVP